MKELREAQGKSIAWAADVGITQMITATLGAGNSPSMEDVKRAADEYNRIAAVAGQGGPAAGSAQRGLRDLDRRRQADLRHPVRPARPGAGQISVPDVDDQRRLRRRRILHEVSRPVLLDAPAGLERRYETIVPVGKGSIDWKKVFAAARTAGVKNYFVEQNMDVTKESVAFLKTLTV
jgi:hypothetical protein